MVRRVTYHGEWEHLARERQPASESSDRMAPHIAPTEVRRVCCVPMLTTCNWNELVLKLHQCFQSVTDLYSPSLIYDITVSMFFTSTLWCGQNKNTTTFPPKLRLQVKYVNSNSCRADCMARGLPAMPLKV
eukprot:6472528-Amphidinium_carterae.1